MNHCFQRLFSATHILSTALQTNCNIKTMSNPLADFLAREQDDLAGLDDDVVSDVPTSGRLGHCLFDKNDLFPGADTPSQNGGLLDDLPALTGGGDSGVDLTQLDRGIGGSPARGGTNGSSPLPSYQPPKIEPEKIRKWRQEQAIRLEKKGIQY
jgi:hypothetical protein